MAAGKVKWFNDERGYGLISVDEHSRDAYVHYSDVGDNEQTLAAGTTVEFRLEKGDKLDRARSVQLATANEIAAPEPAAPADDEPAAETEPPEEPETSPESDDDTP